MSHDLLQYGILAAALLTLLAGPVLFFRSSERRVRRRFLDGFVLTSVSGLVLIFVLPEVVQVLGAMTFLFLFAGLLAPILMESFAGLAARTTHVTALVLALAGLLVHTALDGMVLSHDHNEHYAALALAVVVHRLPVSIVAWKLVADRYSLKAAWSVLALIAGGTVVGFFAGESLPETGAFLAGFQAFVAGSLLHVIGHSHDDHDHGESASCCGPKPTKRKWAEGLGAFTGLALLFAVPLFADHGHGGQEAIGLYANRFLHLALESAPALVAGFFLAGVVGAFLPSRTVKWVASGGTLVRAGKGMAIGIPLPICSCGVVPLYEGLVRRGVPASAAMAFLIATPEIGIESLLLSIPLLGGEVTAVRLAGAAAVALVAGVVVGSRVPTLESQPEQVIVGGSVNRWAAAKHFMQDVLDDTSGWILVGLLVAAFFEPGSLSGMLTEFGPAAQIVVFASLGIPVYVCASGATPLAAALVFAGASPGAAIAFLLAGPATNVTTFGVLARLHSRNIAIAFGLTVFVSAVVVGLTVDTFIDGSSVPNHLGETHHTAWIAMQWAALGVFTLMVVDSVLRIGPGEFLAGVTSLGGHGHHDHDHGHDHGHDHDHHDHDHHDHDHHDHDHHDHDHHDHDHHDHD